MKEPYYSDDYVTIYNGDCFEVMPRLPSVGLVLTDPPWNLGYFKDDNKMWDDYGTWLNNVRILCERKGDTVFIFQSTKCIAHVAAIFKGWGMFANPKNFCQMVPTKLPNAFDLAFFNNSHKYNGGGRNWHIGNNANISNSKTGHPTSRPLDTIKYIISLFDHSIIMDPLLLWPPESLSVSLSQYHRL